MPIVVRIDVELAKRKMSFGAFSERVGLTPANVAVLKNGRAKAVRFSTLEAMCRVLDWMKDLVVILGVAIGVAGIVAGGLDDSPGAQLIGLVIIIGAIALGVRTFLRSR